MKIITDKDECDKIIKNYKNTILDSYGYKKILNSRYNPDSFLFFIDGKDIIPLVVKNDLVTFYGGTQHNHINFFPNNATLINNMLTYLKNQGYSFQLLSMYKDYFNVLDQSNKYFDVPYPTEWHYKNIKQYNKMNIINSFSGKKRVKYNRILRESNKYTFIQLSFAEFKAKYPVLIKAHNNYFLNRGKKSVWEGNENLLLDLLEYFKREENIFIHLIQLDQDVVGLYIHIYNYEEIIYFFASSLKEDDCYISKIMYFDALETAKKIANGTNISELNAARGAFTNKKSFGLKPVPLYALVKDDNWIVQVDKDIELQDYNEIYGRNSWGREK